MRRQCLRASPRARDRRARSTSLSTASAKPQAIVFQSLTRPDPPISSIAPRSISASPRRSVRAAPIVGDVDRLAQRQVFVVRDQDGDRAAVAQERRAVAGQLAFADELAHVVRQSRGSRAAFPSRLSCRTAPRDTRGTPRRAPDASARSRPSPSGSRASRRRRSASLRRRSRRNRRRGPARAARR